MNNVRHNDAHVVAHMLWPKYPFKHSELRFEFFSSLLRTAKNRVENKNGNLSANKTVDFADFLADDAEHHRHKWWYTKHPAHHWMFDRENIWWKKNRKFPSQIYWCDNYILLLYWRSSANTLENQHNWLVVKTLWMRMKLLLCNFAFVANSIHFPMICSFNLSQSVRWIYRSFH